ncbi:LOW QUALITY PROTEIN: ABC transporter G family member 1-like [Oryza brachyantha]|uniref:LOW QUALITY PROTEIN: ABC transporter G family member 1-like n=1 Tax=Oryza brachyantha TaxID=4533 RepID=UPI001ADD4548|nr:LOW QUALITY PROTEIN: ABC transporter G family member 1-like [Oryza brachyantha]
MASEQEPAAVLRWTPSPRRRQDDEADDHHRGAFDMVSDLGGCMRGTEGFPFGSGRSFAPPPFLTAPEAEPPSLEISVGMNSDVALVARDQVTSLRQPDQGAVLAWEDLWVSTAGGNRRRVPILCGLNGYARPGEVLAIMGPSGCGKSTLLDALAGRLGSSMIQKGDVLINGRRQELAFGTSAYVTQDDVLMSTLTVREAVHYSAQLQLPSAMTPAAKRERAEETLREMGLDGAADTLIGGRWAHRGVSGGQRRRVSICTEILTRPALLFLDEPTSGLDSAASYHVVSRISRMARREGMAVVAAVHQPSTEVFGLFHGLCLLAYGKTVFFGPAADTNQFFSMSGFPCPSLMNPSDHFLRTINKDFDKDIEEGMDGKIMTTTQAIDTLVSSYKSSFHWEKVMHRIEQIRANEGQLVKKEGGQPTFLTQSWVLTKRSFVNMYRDLGYYWLRLAIYVSLCLCVGTIYYDVGHTYGSIQARGSMLMFVAAFLTFMAIGGFPSFVEDMKIFGRERLNGHYGVASFVVANTLSSTPYLALISVVPGAIAYYLTGLRSSGEHFGYFAAVLFTTMMVVEGLMMTVASAVPDFLMGIITGAGIQGVMMLNGGFFRLPDDLPKPVWRYPMYYVAFHKYANQGLYKNEFLGLTFPSSDQAGGAATITGGEILRDYWQVQLGYSKWVDLAILIGMVVLYRMLFFVIVKLVEKMKPMVQRLRLRRDMPFGEGYH